jgi:hypothetical protein
VPWGFIGFGGGNSHSFELHGLSRAVVARFQIWLWPQKQRRGEGSATEFHSRVPAKPVDD